MRTLVSLLARLAIYARAEIRQSSRRRSYVSIVGAAPAIAVLGQGVSPNRAGRLVPVPEEALEPEVTHSFGAHWALWAAVALILLVLAAGYLRRRLKGRGQAPTRLPWPIWGRHSGRK